MGEDRRYLRKYLLRCNYFQAIEGDYDPSHGFFLHSTLDGNQSSPGNRLRGGNRLNSFLNRKHVQIEDTLYGQQHIAVTGFREGTNVATISQFFMPSFTGSGISGPNVYASNLRIPIDDESCFHYRLRWSYEPFSQQQVWEDKYGGYTYPEQVPGTFLAKENKDNDYLVDRHRPEELLLHRHQGLPHPGPGAGRGPVGRPGGPELGAAGHGGPEHHRRAPPSHHRRPRADGGRGAQRPQQPGRLPRAHRPHDAAGHPVDRGNGGGGQEQELRPRAGRHHLKLGPPPTTRGNREGRWDRIPPAFELPRIGLEERPHLAYKPPNPPKAVT